MENPYYKVGYKQGKLESVMIIKMLIRDLNNCADKDKKDIEEHINLAKRFIEGVNL